MNHWTVFYQGSFKYGQDVSAIHAAQGTERWCPGACEGLKKENGDYYESYGKSPAHGVYSSMGGGDVVFFQGGAGSTEYKLTFWLETYDGSGSRNYNGKNFAQGTTFTAKMGAVGYQGDYVAGCPEPGFTIYEAWTSDSIGGPNGVQLSEGGSFGGSTYIYYNFYYTRANYNLTYFNGSTPVTTRTMKYDAPLGSSYNLQNLTMTSPYGHGYEFGGWYLDPECTIPVKFDGSERMPDGGMAVYAKWSPITHKVKTYQSKEAIGGTPINTYGISHGEMYNGTVPIPEGEAGMNFIGWFYEEDGKENAYDFSMPVYRDMNLYAKWNSGTSVTGKIYYVDENGNELARHTDITGLVGDTKTYSAKLSSELGDGNTLYLPNVTSHNIKFSGNASQNTFTFVYKAMPEVRYTIKFVNKDNPSHELFDPITDTSKSPTITYDAMAAGKTVEKYYLDKNSKTFVLSSDEKLNVFYFYYTYDPGKATVQVQHYIENADGTGYDFHSETPSTIEELGTLIKAADRKVTINGFTYGYAEFNGDKAEQETLSGGLTVKLYYTRNSYRYTFRFVYKDSQGNEVEFPNSAVTGTAKYNTSVSQPAKIFPGYTTASRTQTLVVFYQESNNVRTFLYEEQNATIRYQVGAVKGGAVSAASETIKAVTGTATGAVAAVSNANYRFIGWFDNYRGNGEPVSTSLSFVPAKNSENVYEAKTYYALFEEIKVDIRYQVQMPAGAAATATLTKNSEQVDVVTGIATGTAVAAIPTDYEFEGWYDANGNKVGSAESFKPTRPADQWVDETTFTAKFVEKKATVNYVAVGSGTVSVFSEKVNKVTGNATGSAAVPTEHYGYFVGWYRDAACTDLVTNGTSIVPGRPSDGWAESQTYYAKFDSVEYTITYVDRGNTHTQTYVKGDKLQPPAWRVQNYVLVWTLKSTDGNWDGAALDGLIYRNDSIEFYGNVTLEAVWTTNVAWVDWDWELEGESATTALLHVDNGVRLGQEFVYDGPALSRETTAEYTYTFENQWERLDIPEVANEPIIIFQAVYTGTKNQYTVTFVLDNGQPNVVQTDVWGTEVTVPTNFTKEGHTFAGWDKTVPTTIPTEDVTVTAQWEIIKYTVKFVNEDGTVLETDRDVPHGTVPSYDGQTPEKAATAEYTYTFAGWTPTVVAATGDKTYTATYTATKNKYTVTWKNEDGTVLETDTGVEYGATPSYDGKTPVKAETAQYTYTFSGWSSAVETVKGNVTYTATFAPHERAYTVTWVNEDGTVLEKDEGVLYNTTPTYNGKTPEKAGNAQYGYTFAGWTPKVAPVTGAATYTATYTQYIKDYTVTWKDEDGTVLETDLDVPYGTMPSYDGETPEKAATAEYTYTFAGWTPSKASVTGDTVYVATYSATPNRYTITWKNGTEVIKTEQLAYGTTVTAPADPTKPGHNFDGWDITVPATMPAHDVTINATWKANTYKVIYFVDGEQYAEAGYLCGTEVAVQKELTKKGYTFSGWTVNGVTVTDGKFEMPDNDVTVSASFTPNTYKVRFDANEGLGAMTDQPFTYDVEQALTANAFTRAEYKFMGWNTKADGTGFGYADMDAVKNLSDVNGDTVTLYAVWEQDRAEYTVEIYYEKADSDDYDKTTEAKPDTIGKEVSVSADAYLKAGFVFEAEKSVVSGEVKSDGSLVLKLYYKRITYKVAGILNGETVFAETVKHGASSHAITFTPQKQYAIHSIKVNNDTVAVTEENKQGYTYAAQSNVVKDITVVVTTVRVKADLTISVTGAIGDQSFVFIVTDSNDREVARVALYPGKTSVKILDVPVGDYTVTPASGWAWRQDLGAKTVTVGVDDEAKFSWSTVDTIIYWLNGYNSKKIQVDASKLKK